MEKALIFSYNNYGGITSRVLLDKFYEFFVKEHASYNCTKHSSLYIDEDRNLYNKYEIGTHFQECPHLILQKKQFFSSYNEDLKKCNLDLNKYIHRNKIYEVIIPNDLRMFSNLIQEIYSQRKSDFNDELNGKNQNGLMEELAVVVLDYEKIKNDIIKKIKRIL